MASPTEARAGHPIAFETVPREALDAHGDAIERILADALCGIIVRGAFPEALRAQAVSRLCDPALGARWASPNAGMRGGEIRVIGDAATPTFTALRGPSLERYARNAQRHADHAAAVFSDPGAATATVSGCLSALFGGRPAAPARLVGDPEGRTWAPYSLRALDPGEQIYSHHDDHYGLEVYQALDPALDRQHLLSYFVTLQAPEGGGQLTVYGLWGNDPEVPMLPTRFIDTEALEARFHRQPCALEAGDLVVFNAGRYVHRVTPVAGPRPRLTLGGFLTVAADRSRLAYWS